MLKAIKNLRKLSNAKVLIISGDTSIQSDIEASFDGYFKKLIFSDNKNDALDKLSSDSFDILAIDTDVNDTTFNEMSNLIQQSSPLLPKIVISKDYSDANILDAVNMFSYTFLSKPLNIQDFRLSVIMCLNQTKRGDKIEFEKGFYYDEYREQFFNKNNRLIELTKLEYGLLKLLLERKGDITDYDIIQKEVWKGKKMSIFTMRNVVNKIRQKLYYEIIKNHSNKGYTIGKFKS